MKKKKFSTAFWLYCLLALLTLAFVALLHNLQPVIHSLDKDNGASFSFLQGRVVTVGATAPSGDIDLSVLAEDGEKKGLPLPAPQSGLNTYNKYKEGDRVLVAIHTDRKSGKTPMKPSTTIIRTGFSGCF